MRVMDNEEQTKAILDAQTEQDAEDVIAQILEEEFLNEKVRPAWSPAEAERIVRRNIGYMAGYYDQTVQERIYRLFKTEHPIFGTDHPTFEQALWSGVRMIWERGGGESLSSTDIEKMLEHTKDVKKWRKE